MSLKFPGTQISKTSFSSKFDDSIYRLNNIERQLSLLSETGQTNRVSYKTDTLSQVGNSGRITQFYRTINNHFQSIVRLPQSNYLVMSGGDSIKKHSHLLVIKMTDYLAGSSVHHDAPYGSNIVNKDTWRKDSLENLFFIDNSGFWHAGGISLMGDVLTVAVESTNESRIVFINFSNPQKPEYISEIVRSQVGSKNVKAGAASTVKLTNGHYLTAVWSDSDDFEIRFDFYISSQAERLDSTFLKCCTVSRNSILGESNSNPRLQTIQFIRNELGDLYILGADNKSKLGNSTNRIFLFELDVDSKNLLVDAQNGINTSQHITIIMKAKRNLLKGRKYYNFGSAPGFYVHPNKNNLIAYCGFTWKRLRPLSLNICEFSPRILPSKPAISHINEAVIELYTGKHFTGRMLVLYGDRYKMIPDLSSSKIADTGDMNNRIESIRLILPVNRIAIFYEDKNFNYGDTTKNELQIKGTGTVINVPDLSDLDFITNYTGGDLQLRYQRAMSRNIASFKLT